jgi:hypothetical protein
MPTLAGALTGLGLLALPALPSPTYRVNLALTETLSLQWNEGVSTAIPVIPVSSGADTWSLSLTELPGSTVTTYAEQLTQLGGLALPTKYVAVTAKAFTSNNGLFTVDGWGLSWTESPTDSETLDTWDTWALSLSEVSALQISQTFTANDVWGLQWLDTSSVFSGAPVFLTLSDTWSLSWTEAASALAVSIASAGDTLSLSLADSSALAVTQDAKTGSNDAWSLTLTETAFVGVLATVPILGSDQWLLSSSEASNVSIFTPPPPDLSPGRIVLTRAQSYIVRVR